MVLGGLIKPASSNCVFGMGINDCESVQPVITVIHTRQMHELMFPGISCHRNAIFIEGKMIQEINSIIVCQRNGTGYRF